MLSVQDDAPKDKWPAKYLMVEQKVVDEKTQMWYWNSTTGGMHNKADPTFWLDFDYGWAMIGDVKSKSADKAFPKKIRSWFYEQTTSQLTTDVDGVSSSLVLMGQPKNWSKVQIVPTESLKDANKNTGTWRIEYCNRR